MVFERSLRVAALALAILVYLAHAASRTAHPLLFGFFLVGSLVMTFAFGNEAPTSIERRPLLATADALATLFVVMFSGGASSPFMFYFFSVVVTLARLLPPFSAMFYAAVMMLFLLSDVLARAPRAFAQNLFVLLPSLAGLTILTGVVSYLANRLEELPISHPEPVAESPGPASTEFAAADEEPGAGSKEPGGAAGEAVDEAGYVDQLWDVIDFLRDLDRSPSIEACARNFLAFLSRHGMRPAFALHLKKEQLLELFSMKDGDIEVVDLKGYIDENSGAIGTRITVPLDGFSLDFEVATSTPEAAFYMALDELPDEGFSQGVVRLASELTTFRIAELLLETKEAILLSRFASLYNAASEVEGTLDRRAVLESAASAVKGLTGMEKVVVMLAGSPDDVELDFSRTVVKGRVVEHPEAFWRNPLLSAGKTCLARHSPIMTAVEGTSSHMLCVPIRLRDHTFGLIAGLTSLSPEEVAGDLKTIEVIAALVATTLSNIDLLEQREAVAVASEKDRIARDMYRTLMGALYQLLISTENALHALRSRSPEVLSRLLTVREEIRSLTRSTREFVYHVYPDARRTMGVRAALQKLVSSYEAPELVDVSVDENLPVLPIEVEHAILKIAHESITNALRHGEARSVRVELTADRERVTLTVRDNGKGFSPRAALEKIKEERKVGIQSMFDAARSAGGTLQISSRPGAGATVRALFPLAASEPESPAPQSHASN